MAFKTDKINPYYKYSENCSPHYTAAKRPNPLPSRLLRFRDSTQPLSSPADDQTLNGKDRHYKVPSTVRPSNTV